MVDQALIADDQGNPVLAAFASLGGSTQNATNVVDLGADGGLTWFAPFPSRPNDVLGIALSVLRFTSDFQQQEQAAGTPVGGGETVLEVTYQLAIAPWLVVQPDAQFFFNPPVSRRDAQALGVEAVVIF
jgi:porin